LRSALRDHAHEPHAIRTVHGFGYAFIAPVRASTATDAPVCRFRLLLQGREVPLPFGESVIGRDAQADLFIEDASVSRRHALIHVEGSRALLEDLGSKNGTSLNGTPLHGSSALTHGDVIGIGVVQAVFRDTTSATSTLTIRREASRERKPIKFRKR